VSRPARGRLAGKVAMVPGAGSQGAGWGTGKAMSVLFAREGAQLCLVDVDPARAEETLAILRDEAGEGFVVAGGVLDAAGCPAAVGAGRAAFGQLDGLRNNRPLLPPATAGAHPAAACLEQG